ncbi:HEAT repeat-containing protein 4 [Podochytrium sp. JEL0797]|nr:HEAT repeat-containing protein 4 [Podochytrium sp. JEL0797]
MQGVQAIAIPPIPRPHRKDVLELTTDTSEHPNHYPNPQQKLSTQFIQSLREATPAGSKVMYPSGSKASSIPQTQKRRYENSIAAAIDVPFVTNTRVPCVHPPPRLPPCYEASLKDIKRLKKVLKEYEQDAIHPSFLSTNLLGLKFEARVSEKFASWPHHLADSTVNIFNKEDVSLPTNSQLAEAVKMQQAYVDAEVPEIPNTQIHKSTWLRDVTRHSGNHHAVSHVSGSKPVESVANDSLGGGDKSDAFDAANVLPIGYKFLKGSERNVPYMLELWQRVEGVNLEEVLHIRTDKKPESVPPQTTLKEGVLPRIHITPTASLENLSPSKSRGPSVSVQLISVGTDAATGGSAAHSRNSSTIHQSRRHSKISFELSLESTPPPSDITSNSQNPPPQPTSTRPSSARAPADPETLDPPPPIGPPPAKKLLSTSTLLLLKKLTIDARNNNNTTTLGPTTSAPVPPPSTDPAPTAQEVDQALRLVLTGTGEKAAVFRVPGGKLADAPPRKKRNTYRFKAAGGFVIDTEPPKEGDFELVIPLPEEIEVDLEDAVAYNVGVGGGGVGMVKGGGDVREKTGAGGAQILSHQLGQNVTRYKTQESTIITYDPSTPLKILDMSDFLATPYIFLTHLPTPGSQAYSILHQTCLHCLLNPESWDLRFEAARLLILLQDFQHLPRWETIAFKTVLQDAVAGPPTGGGGFGTPDDSFLAGICLCQMGFVDSKTVRKVKQGLGDFRAPKRRAAVSCLSTLDAKHANGILDMLIAESENTSWRVRVDVIELMRVWIQRIDPDQYACGEEEEVVGSVDAIDCMSRQIKADQEEGEDSSRLNSAAKLANSHTKLYGGSSSRLTPTRSDNRINTPPAQQYLSTSLYLSSSQAQLSKSKSKLKQSTFGLNSSRLEIQINRAIGVLLNFMWQDWSKEVRSLATKTLARLNQGKQAFDWIISLLEMPDPGKKIDALRCLSEMGVVTSNAMALYLKTFTDPFYSVRLEACKVACGIVTAANRDLVNTLLGRFDDFDTKVRAFAVKAIGLSKCREPRIRESLYWSLIHDKSPSVRAESIHAIVELGLLLEDTNLRESVFVLMDTDVDEGVRKEAERALVKGRFVLGTTVQQGTLSTEESNGEPEKGVDSREVTPNSGTSGEDYKGGKESEGGDKTASSTHQANQKTVAAVPGMSMLLPSKQHPKRTPIAPVSSSPLRSNRDGITRVPQTVLPDAIKGLHGDEVELYFRDSIVGEMELQAVIDQVKDMSVASTVLYEVEQMEREASALPELGLDLEFRKVEKFHPSTRRNTKLPTGIKYTTNRRISLL